MPFSRGAALDFLQRQYQGPLREVDIATITVGTGVVNVVSRDNDRISLTMVNLGTTQIFVAPVANPSLTRGIRLGPSGGTLVLMVSEDGILPALEWNAVGDVAGGSLYVLPVRRETEQLGP